MFDFSMEIYHIISYIIYIVYDNIIPVPILYIYMICINMYIITVYIYIYM